MITLLLPAYNEASGIASLLAKVRETMQENGLEYQVLVINDGSRDGTHEEIEPFKESMPVEVLDHPRNRGLWETVRDGFEWAAERSERDDIIIRMDADDTHEPRYVPALVEKIEEGYDVVITSRFQPGGGTEGLNMYRTLISRGANLLMKGIFPIRGIWEYSCGYRAYRAGIVQDALEIFGNEFIDLKGVGFTCTLEKLLKFRMMGARITEIPFVLRYDQKRSPSKMITSITTLGYLVLILKYVRPWGETGARWQSAIDEWRERRARDEGPGIGDS